jgi:putative permease
MDFTVARFLRYLIIIFFIAVTGWLLYSLSDILTLLIIAFLLAYILDPVACYFEAKGLSRSSATLIIFSTIFTILGIVGWLFLPRLFNELLSLQNTITAEDSGGFIIAIETFVEKNIPFVDIKEFDLYGKISMLLNSISGQMLIILGNLVSLVSTLVIIPFVVFFLLRDGRKMKKIFIEYIPNRYFEMTLNFLHKVDQQLGSYLRGQFTEAFIVGLLSVSALWILDVKYFTLIGIFAGLANMIPYVGPVAGAIPAIIVVIVNDGSTSMVLYVVLAFAIVQIIDNIILQPLVMSKSVNLHPLAIVLAILVAGKFFGLLGMLLAVPAAGVIKVTSKELYQGIRRFRLI